MWKSSRGLDTYASYCIYYTIVGLIIKEFAFIINSIHQYASLCSLYVIEIGIYKIEFAVESRFYVLCLENVLGKKNESRWEILKNKKMCLHSVFTLLLLLQTVGPFPSKRKCEKRVLSNIWSIIILVSPESPKLTKWRS